MVIVHRTVWAHHRTIGNVVRIPSLLWRLDFQYVVNCRVANGPEEGMKTARDVRLHIKCRSDGLETEFPGHPRCLIWCGLHFVRSSRFSEFFVWLIHVGVFL